MHVKPVVIKSNSIDLFYYFR